MTVLFHFSLSISGYEYRRRLTNSQRTQTLPSTSNETDSLTRNQQIDRTNVESDDDKISNDSNVIVTVPKKNFFKSPLLYQNALLYVFSRLFMTTSLVSFELLLDQF